MEREAIEQVQQSLSNEKLAYAIFQCFSSGPPSRLVAVIFIYIARRNTQSSISDMASTCLQHAY